MDLLSPTILEKKMSNMRDAALSSKAWPFEEARRVLKRYEKAPPEKGYVLFETDMVPLVCPISAPLERCTHHDDHACVS